MTVGHNYSMTINGEAVSSTSSIDVINPATEEVFAQAPECSREQLDAAVRAAHRAFAGWSATPYEQRQALVHALGQAILDNLDTLSTLLTREQGKPLFDLEGEASVPLLAYSAGAFLGRSVNGLLRQRALLPLKQQELRLRLACFCFLFRQVRALHCRFFPALLQSCR